MAPLLVIILLGAIDIGQYVHVAQTISNASRETARFACKHDTETIASVEEHAIDYLQNAFPRLSEKEIVNALVVAVSDPVNSDSAVTSMEAIESGDSIAVTVHFDFAAVRWLRNVDYWDLDQSGVTTIMRRD